MFDLLFHHELDFIGNARSLIFDLVDRKGAGFRDEDHPASCRSDLR